MWSEVKVIYVQLCECRNDRGIHFAAVASKLSCLIAAIVIDNAEVGV